MASATEEQLERLKDRVREFATGFAASHPGLDLTARVDDDGTDGVLVTLEGEDAGRFVGRSGQALDALGYLATLSVHGRGSGGARLRILFDAEEYRRRREETLCQLAHELADQVRATGQEAVLDPLSPMERRIVHNAVLDEPGVRTYSEGQEPERYVIISPDTGE